MQPNKTGVQANLHIHTLSYATGLGVLPAGPLLL